MPTRKALSVIPPAGIVVKVPGTAALTELLERITQAGVELDPGSKLTALVFNDRIPLHAHAMSAGARIEGPSCRRRASSLR